MGRGRRGDWVDAAYEGFTMGSQVGKSLKSMRAENEIANQESVRETDVASGEEALTAAQQAQEQAIASAEESAMASGGLSDAQRADIRAQVESDYKPTMSALIEGKDRAAGKEISFGTGDRYKQYGSMGEAEEAKGLADAQIYRKHGMIREANAASREARQGRLADIQYRGALADDQVRQIVNGTGTTEEKVAALRAAGQSAAAEDLAFNTRKRGVESGLLGIQENTLPQQTQLADLKGKASIIGAQAELAHTVGSALSSGRTDIVLDIANSRGGQSLMASAAGLPAGDHRTFTRVDKTKDGNYALVDKDGNQFQLRAGDLSSLYLRLTGKPPSFKVFGDSKLGYRWFNESTRESGILAHGLGRDDGSGGGGGGGKKGGLTDDQVLGNAVTLAKGVVNDMTNITGEDRKRFNAMVPDVAKRAMARAFAEGRPRPTAADMASAFEESLSDYQRKEALGRVGQGKGGKEGGTRDYSSLYK